MQLAVDHIGYQGPDIESLCQQFTVLGFRVLGPVKLAAGGDTDPHVQLSAHIMFADHYIELTALRRAVPGHRLNRWHESPPAVRLLLLRCADAAAVRNRLLNLGYPVSELMQAQRRLPEEAETVARFRWFELLDEPLPGMLTGCVEQLTPQLVFAPAAAGHPNTVHALSALYHRPTQLPAVLGEFAGAGIQLRADRQAKPSGSFITGIEMLAESLQNCERQLQESAVDFRREADVIRINAATAGGTWIKVREQRC